jgi:hypothetical protein
VVLPLPGGTQFVPCPTHFEVARQAIKAAWFQGERDSRGVTARLGAAECLDADTSAGLVKRAEDAPCAVKQSGRNRAFWDDGFHGLPLFDRPVDRGGRAVVAGRGFLRERLNACHAHNDNQGQHDGVFHRSRAILATEESK